MGRWNNDEEIAGGPRTAPAGGPPTLPPAGRQWPAGLMLAGLEFKMMIIYHLYCYSVVKVSGGDTMCYGILDD